MPDSSWPTSRSESVHGATGQGASARLPDIEFGIESHRADCGSRPSSRQWMRNVAELRWKLHSQGQSGVIRVVATSSSANGRLCGCRLGMICGPRQGRALKRQCEVRSFPDSAAFRQNRQRRNPCLGLGAAGCWSFRGDCSQSGLCASSVSGRGGCRRSPCPKPGSRGSPSLRAAEIPVLPDPARGRATGRSDAAKVCRVDSRGCLRRSPLGRGGRSAPPRHGHHALPHSR